jgi:hypothetical protein
MTGEPPSSFAPLTWRMPAEIEPLVEALEQAGLRCMLADESQVRLREGASMRTSGGIYVFVHADDLARAREVEQRLLRETLHDLPPESEAHRDDACPACGEPLAPHAAECPECGLVFPDASG